MVLPGTPPNGGAAGTAAPGEPKVVSPRSDDSRGAPPAWQGSNEHDQSRLSLHHAQAGASKFGSSMLSLQRVTSKKGLVKVWLTQSSFYNSRFAAKLRKVLQSKSWAGVMVLALLIALFMPDTWVICGVNENTVIDTVLTIVMCLFGMELLALSCVDANYVFSFFQLMDLIGTITMIFDIAYMLGDSATEPQKSGNADTKKSYMLLRATRAAKVGARAGRLSRVLRILRFLPFLGSGVHQEDDVSRAGMASVISGQLANLLATRVACLTIILFVVIPQFDLFTFPQTDYSLDTWVQRISKDFTDGRTNDTAADLRLMASFYGKYEYGPYLACPGTNFVCAVPNKLQGVWTPQLGGPPRAASALIVTTDSLLVFFNMHSTIRFEAGLSIATICFIILIMVFSGLALSSVVQELAVRPLERMLETVRKIASTVFKFSAEVQPDLGDQEMADQDINSSNEMKLLEKVVQKLAIIADLQTAKNVPATTEDMRDEDIGILSMMHGKNIVEEQVKNERGRTSMMPKKRTMVQQVRLEDFGVSHEVFNSWTFNPLPLSKSQRIALAVFTISKFQESVEGFTSSPEEAAMLQRFTQAVEKEYLPVPFHSFAHAIDVVHAVSRMLRLTGSENFLSELEQFALLIAALGHDIGHPGVNNGFLSEVGHELALQYNDKSPLENMHCAKLYTLMANPSTNVFSKLSKDQYKEVRKHIIETILHTDMMLHQAMVKDLQMTYQMNTEVFTHQEGGASATLGLAETEIFSQGEGKTLFMNCILHSADVSNPCKNWDVTHAWAMVCLEEFFAQGDQEKMLGIPVQFLNNRDTLNRPNSQIGFIEFMIAPFCVAQLWLFPSLRELGENLAVNLTNWEDMWVKETTPSEEDRLKVKARVDKVKANIQAAIRRG